MTYIWLSQRATHERNARIAAEDMLSWFDEVEATKSARRAARVASANLWFQRLELELSEAATNREGLTP